MEAFFNHLNPAVIRSILSKMSRVEFIECAELIKQKALDTCPVTKRAMYVSLFAWGKIFYQKKFKLDQETLFDPID